MSEKQIKEAINGASNVLLHCHPSPDPDSYGSALAMYHYLTSIGKKATVISGDSPVPDFAEFLPGADKIVIKNFLEIDSSQFDLFLMLDIGALDRVSALGPVNIPSTMRTVLIDHHSTTAANIAEIQWVDPNYAATAEMVHDLLTGWGAQISKEMAECLLLGLYSDTGGFKYPSTTPNTFRAAAHLAALAPDYGKLIFKMENNRRPGFIKFQTLAFNSLQTFFDDRVAITAINHQEITSARLSQADVAGVSLPNILKSVVGWEIGISITEWEPGKIGVSARTRDADRFDLTKFVALLGGGGHKAAAGAQFQATIPEAREKVLAALRQAYPELA